jgi:hypothetical protein
VADNWLLTADCHPVQSSNLWLAFANTVVLGFGPLQDPLPNFCSFKDIYNNLLLAFASHCGFWDQLGPMTIFFFIS